jgi:hypothetical protein
MTAAQMACCAATDHDCEAAAAAEDCCRSENGDQAQLVTNIQQPVSPPALISTTIPFLVRPVDANAVSAFHDETTKIKSDSPPTYVLLASFLI